MELPDGRKSLLHYCQVTGVLAGVDFTSSVLTQRLILAVTED